MAALEQLHGGLAFADATLPQEQHTLAVYLHQHAVAGDPGGQSGLQIGDDGGDNGAGGLFAAQHGDVVLPGHGQALVVRGDVPGDEQGGELVGQQSVEDHGALRRGELFQIAHFHIAQHLQTHRLKMVKISGKLQSRPGHILHRQTDVFVVRGGEGHLEVELLHQGHQGYAVGIDQSRHLILQICHSLYLPWSGISIMFWKKRKKMKKGLAFLVIVWYHIEARLTRALFP